MLKFGTISEVDFPAGLARVNFEEDDFVSGWLKISVMRSGPDQVYLPFDINEKVWCMMDEHCEYGVIGGAYYDETNKPSGGARGKLKIAFSDNSTIEYDRNSHILKLDIAGKITVQSAGEVSVQAQTIKANASSIEITSPSVKITSAATEITGTLSVAGMVSVGGLSGPSGGPVNASGADLNVKKINASDDVVAGTISLKTHKHVSAASGSPTSTPTP